VGFVDNIIGGMRDDNWGRKRVIVLAACFATTSALLPGAAVSLRMGRWGPVPRHCLELRASISGPHRGATGARSERAAACSVEGCGGALGARVRQALERERWPFVVPSPAAGIQLSDDIVFSDGLMSLRGREEYLAASAAFQVQILEGPIYSDVI
jgi:hypothetical protein